MVVNLQHEEWNRIINLMAQAPYNQVAELIQKIVTQLQGQVVQPPPTQPFPAVGGNGRTAEEG